MMMRWTFNMNLNFMNTLISTLSFFLLYLVLNASQFFDFISYCMSCLSILIAILCMTLTKIYSNNYFKSMKKVTIFLMLYLFLFFSFFLDDFFYFYIMFELSVVPIFFYIVNWGTSYDKMKASMFLFFYTYFSSLLFLVYMLKFFNMYQSLDFISIFMIEASNVSKVDILVIMAMTLVFLVKLPVFIFHTWLPLAHVESPLIGSILLASLMLKLGGYGLVRLIDIFFYNLTNSNSYFVIMGMWGAIISAFVCLSQFDLKKMVAYSSVSHMSLMMGSIFSFYVIGKIGSIFMMIGHGFISSSMFLGLGMIYYRIFSRNYFLMSSMLLTIPSFFLWWFLIISMNMSLPPFISFLSELLIFSSYIFFDYLFSIFSFILIIFTSLYSIMLFMYPTSGMDKSTFFESDLKISESLVMFAHSFFFVISMFFYWILF